MPKHTHPTGAPRDITHPTYLYPSGIPSPRKAETGKATKHSPVPSTPCLPAHAHHQGWSPYSAPSRRTLRSTRALSYIGRSSLQAHARYRLPTTNGRIIGGAHARRYLTPSSSRNEANALARHRLTTAGAEALLAGRDSVMKAKINPTSETAALAAAQPYAHAANAYPARSPRPTTITARTRRPAKAEPARSNGWPTIRSPASQRMSGPPARVTAAPGNHPEGTSAAHLPPPIAVIARTG